jgi:hypothetical protein
LEKLVIYHLVDSKGLVSSLYSFGDFNILVDAEPTLNIERGIIEGIILQPWEEG